MFTLKLRRVTGSHVLNLLDRAGHQPSWDICFDSGITSIYLRPANVNTLRNLLRERDSQLYPERVVLRMLGTFTEYLHV